LPSRPAGWRELPTENDQGGRGRCSRRVLPQGRGLSGCGPLVRDDGLAAHGRRLLGGRLGEAVPGALKTLPDDYSITAYDGTLVVLDAIKRVAEIGKEINRSNVRDAMQATKLTTLQGEVSFDQNGDMVSKVVSVFQFWHNPKYPDDDIIHQHRYEGTAPEGS
jgi:hypothetical protein